MQDDNVNILDDPFDPTGPDVDDPLEITPPTSYFLYSNNDNRCYR